MNPRASLLYGASPITIESTQQLAGKRVVVVEDGPSVMRGGMPRAAGHAAAVAAGAIIVDPRPYATGELAETYERYPHLRDVLPAIGYTPSQVAALKATLARVPADTIVSGTAVDLAALLGPGKRIVRATYEYADVGTPTLWEAVAARLAPHG